LRLIAQSRPIQNIIDYRALRTISQTLRLNRATTSWNAMYKQNRVKTNLCKNRE